ncbi:MAG: HD domain-containing protein [Acidobacteriota bacterium]
MSRARSSAAALLQRRLRRDSLLASLGAAAREHRWEVHLVGGGLRDLLTGRAAHDLDLILGPPVDPVLAWLHRRSSHRPVSFETRILTHRLTIDGRSVDCVERAPRSLVRELGRRDFTVGAIAFDLAAWQVRDPWHGLRDLRLGRLDPPRDDAFRTDPLRILRGVRLGLQHPRLRLTRRAIGLMRASVPALLRVSPERLRDELDRILLSPRASHGIRQLDRLGALSRLFPELESCRGVIQNRHHHLDVFEHTLLALHAADHPGALGRGVIDPARDAAALSPAGQLTLRWSLLIHDLGKPPTRTIDAAGQVHFFGHEQRSAQLVAAIAARFALSRERQRAIETVVRQHLRLVVMPDGCMSDRALARVIRDVAPHTATLALHALADKRASRGVSHARTTTRLRATAARLLTLQSEIAARTARGTLVSGRDVMELLGCPPGPQVGSVLAQVEERRELGELSSREEALQWIRALSRQQSP